MSDLLVRNLNANTIDHLKMIAAHKGRSLQVEVKDILEQAAQVDRQSALRLAAALRKKFKGRKMEDSVELIREDRER